MQKYKVSLAILQPKNYEVEVEAESEEEAIKLAIEDFNYKASGEVVDVDGGELQGDFIEDGNIGIDVAEVENEWSEGDDNLFYEDGRWKRRGWYLR